MSQAESRMVRQGTPFHRRDNKNFKCGEWHVLGRATKQWCQMCGVPMKKGDKVWRFKYTQVNNHRMIYIHAKHFKIHKASQCPQRLKKVTGTATACILCEEE